MEEGSELEYTADRVKRSTFSWIVLVYCWLPGLAQAQVNSDNSWAVLVGSARRLAENGRLDEARGLLIKARQVAERPGSWDAASLAVTQNDLGTVYHALGRYSDAEQTYVSTIRLLNEHGGGMHPVMSRILDNLASLYMDFGARYAEAERLRRRALELRIAEVGPEGPGIATLLSNIGSVCMAVGRIEEADELFRRALEVLGKVGGQDDATAGGVLQNLAMLSASRGDYSQAAEYLGRAVAILEKVFGEDHPDLIRPLLNVARVQILLNRPLAAEPVVSRAQRITEKRLGREHPLMIDILRTHENILRRTKRKAEAQEVKRRADAVLASNPDLRIAGSKVHIADLMRAK